GFHVTGVQTCAPPIFPPEDGPRFRRFIEHALEGVNLPPEERMANMQELFDYLYEQIHDHLDNPRDDLTTYLIEAELFGRKLEPEIGRASCRDRGKSRA